MGDLIGNKIADKITSIGKSKEKKKTNKVEEIYIPPEKRQQIIDDLRLFWAKILFPLYKKWNFKKLRVFSTQTLMIKIYQGLLLKVTKKQHAVSGIIIEMKHVIFFLLILNLSNTRQVLQGKHDKIMIH